MFARTCCAAIVLATLACAEPVARAPLACEPAENIASLPAALDEASGVAFSRRQPGVLWAVNDSERTPRLFAIDTTGKLVAEIAVRTPSQSDWEDLAVGPCGADSCLYIADIGDNRHQRDDRAILRVREPAPDALEVHDVARFPIRYPDGPADAEALFVLADTSIYIVTKGRNGPATVYRYPPPLRSDQRITLERVQLLSDGIEQVPDLVTGASATSDGRHVAIRTYSHLQLYTFAGNTLTPRLEGRGLSLTSLRESQGEGVALHDDGTLIFVSERGPAGNAAPLSRARCRLAE